MREIKFRAWILPTTRMVDVTGLCYTDEGLQVECLRVDETSQEWWWAEREAILREYTGLHDKAGTEIYEGDIVLSIKGDKWTVEYDAWADDCGFLVYGWSGVGLHDESTVLGDIHQNPELMK